MVHDAWRITQHTLMKWAQLFGFTCGAWMFSFECWVQVLDLLCLIWMLGSRVGPPMSREPNTKKNHFTHIYIYIYFPNTHWVTCLNLGWPQMKKVDQTAHNTMSNMQLTSCLTPWLSLELGLKSGQHVNTFYTPTPLLCQYIVSWPYTKWI